MYSYLRNLFQIYIQANNLKLKLCLRHITQGFDVQLFK